MTTGAVLSFCPYVAMLDVTVELHLVTMEITLCFGPFNAECDARKWLDEVERVHKVIEGSEAEEDEDALDATGLPTAPFIRSYVHGSDIIIADQHARKPGELIPPGTPEHDARMLCVYALYGLEQAVGDAIEFVHDADGLG